MDWKTKLKIQQLEASCDNVEIHEGANDRIMVGQTEAHSALIALVDQSGALRFEDHREAHPLRSRRRFGGGRDGDEWRDREARLRKH